MLGMASLDDRVTLSEYVDRLQTWIQTCFIEVWNSLKKFRK